MIVEAKTTIPHLPLTDIETRACDLVSQHLAIPRSKISVSSRFTQDLMCDSIDFLDLLMTFESTFAVTLSRAALNPVCKAVFTRPTFCIADLAELIYLQQGTGTPKRCHWREPKPKPASVASVPFTQLNGCWQKLEKVPLLEPLQGDKNFGQFRRRCDGMRCLLIPSAEVEIGCDAPYSQLDERPKHIVEMDSFLIDAEPVSTTAYCRFLNSVGDRSVESLADWFVLDPDDDRVQHMLIESSGAGWRPLPGTEHWPMILVSWYGANAYSLWANGRDWSAFRDDDGLACNLPSEAQWEYAARGERGAAFPWGDAAPSHEQMRFGQHQQAATYQAATLPMAAVHERIGMSPFGLHHMAGNVWQWCRDWYADDFYARPEAKRANPLNKTATGVRVERGGSWVGPAELCRSSFRRGRPPTVRGRCLGFRCVSGVD